MLDVNGLSWGNIFGFYRVCGTWPSGTSRELQFSVHLRRMLFQWYPLELCM